MSVTGQASGLGMPEDNTAVLRPDLSLPARCRISSFCFHLGRSGTPTSSRESVLKRADYRCYLLYSRPSQQRLHQCLVEQQGNCGAAKMTHRMSFIMGRMSGELQTTPWVPKAKRNQERIKG